MPEPARTGEDVRRILADQISAGHLRPGQRLGAERALAAELGVSRAALRRVLSAGLSPCDETAARALRLHPADLVIDLVRIRLADGSPFSVEHLMLPADRFPGLLEAPLGGSMYELLAERYRTLPKEAVERIEVVSASSDEAMILDVPPGAPLLSVTRTTTH